MPIRPDFADILSLCHKPKDTQMETIVAIIIALLGILFGYRLKAILADRAKQDDLTAKMGLAYHEGFDDGYNAAS